MSGTGLDALLSPPGPVATWIKPHGHQFIMDGGTTGAVLMSADSFGSCVWSSPLPGGTGASFADIYTLSGTLTSAQILSMSEQSAFVTIVPAPGLGKAISPIGGFSQLIFNTTPYSASGAYLNIGWGSNANGLDISFTGPNTLGASSNTFSTGTSAFADGIPSSQGDNAPLTLTCANPITTGDSTLKYTIYYTIVDL